MSEYTLTKDHIKKILQIHEHFKDIENYSVTVSGDLASVHFNLDELNTKDSTRFKPTIYK